MRDHGQELVYISLGIVLKITGIFQATYWIEDVYIV